MSLCAVCAQPSFKYKCPQCKAPSCSLPCFKSHREGCQNVVSDTVASQGASFEERADTPFSRGVDMQTHSSDAFDSLFIQYPHLKAQLRSIYEATRDPRDQNSSRAGTRHPDGAKRDRGWSGRYWSPEKGFEDGLKVLRDALDGHESNAEGLQSFVKLVVPNSSSENDQETVVKHTD